MPEYSNLRTTAFQPAAPGQRWAVPYFSIAFPQDWYGNLQKLYGLNKPHLMTSPPIDDINRLMRATMPSVIAARGAARDGMSPWLYAKEVLEPQTLAAVLNTWIRTLRPEAKHVDRTEDVIELIDALNLNWHEALRDLISQTTSPAGTAVPDGLVYQLVPEVLASRITALPPFEFRGRKISFRLGEADDGTTLVSWPPLVHHVRKKPWFYSATIKVVVRTTPLLGVMRVHLACGLRRWVSRPGVPLRYGKHAGTQLLITDQENPLASGRLMTSFITNKGGDVGVSWTRKGPEEVLNLLGSDSGGFPTPADFVADPQRWLRGDGGVAAGILHKTGRGPHAVLPGIMPVERAALTEWAAQALVPEFERVPDLVRSSRKRRPGNARKAEPKEIDVERSLADRRSGLADALGGRLLEVDVLWQEAKTRDALISALEDTLGLPRTLAADTDWIEWHTDELDVRLRLDQVGALCGDMVIPPGGSKAARTAAGVDARVSDVSSYFSLVDAELNDGHRGRLALVELDNAEGFTSETDPKQALRLGFAAAGRLTQFIALTGADSDPDLLKSLDERAASSWLDGFRQLGQRLHPEHSLGSLIPSDLQYIALWLVKREKSAQVPRHRHQLIAIRVRPNGPRFVTEGWDEEEQLWLPYSTYLLRLATKEYPKSDNDNKRWAQQADVQRAIKALLYEARSTPTLVFVQGQNLRGAWPWLGNAHVAPDQLQFGDALPQPISLYGNALRLMRLTSNEREETPEAFAPAASPEDHGLSSGIWMDDDEQNDRRVFYSTTEKPAPMKNVSVKVGKIAPRPDRSQDPTTMAWNPAVVEMFLLGCVSSQALVEAGLTSDPDDPEDWAALTHQLRRVADYLSPLKLPLPLHLAKLAGQYVLMHKK